MQQAQVVAGGHRKGTGTKYWYYQIALCLRSAREWHGQISQFATRSRTRLLYRERRRCNRPPSCVAASRARKTTAFTLVCCPTTLLGLSAPQLRQGYTRCGTYAQGAWRRCNCGPRGHILDTFGRQRLGQANRAYIGNLDWCFQCF